MARSGYGDGANSEPQTDLLGNVEVISEALPYRLAVFRWHDLLENRDREPVGVFQGGLNAAISNQKHYIFKLHNMFPYWTFRSLTQC